MRQGVAGFQGARLVQAREARGLTQSALGLLIERSSTAISRWEKGDQFPEIDALDSLQTHLKIPTSWFLKPAREYGNEPYFFRSNSAITRLARSVARRRLEFTHEISLSLQEWVEWPTVNVPCLDPNDYLTLTDQDIEKLALDLRKHWKLGVGPISDINLLLENAGVVISREEIGYTNMDGVSKWFEFDNRPYIFLASDKANGFRQRFDTAHELAHLVLHRHLTGIEFNSRYKEIEHQANMFAGAFLLPSESFSAELSTPSLDTYAALKNRWKVSIGATIYRSKQLELISDEYALRLWKNYSSRGWRKGEPGDDKTGFEEIRLMPRAINLMMANGGFTSQRLLSEIDLFAIDVENLCGLPQRFFTEQKNNVIQLKLKNNAISSTSFTHENNNVVSIDSIRKPS